MVNVIGIKTESGENVFMVTNKIRLQKDFWDNYILKELSWVVGGNMASMIVRKKV